MNPIIIIGGGPAGVEAAASLADNNHQVLLFEKEVSLAQKVNGHYTLFPTFTDAEEVAEKLVSKVVNNPLVSVHVGAEVVSVKQHQGQWEAEDRNGEKYQAAAVLLCTGYEIFDARRKEELGFGIYDGIITSEHFEHLLKEGKIVNSMGETPRRIVFLQCVGSRDEKTGNHYCSKVCCITAVKQSIDIKRLLPDAEVFCFYMDLRMTEQSYEELYRQAQEDYGVKFVRGRISEAAATFDGRIQIKAEDTLVGLPLKMSTDLLVLMVGMEASSGTRNLGNCCGLEQEYGFIHSKKRHLEDNLTAQDGLFLAGSCKRPMNLPDCIADARSAAIEIINYLKTR
ncbi:MAG: FAD-dependent oxidoreductase [Lentimicrobiaceae bacterium]|nr:FAD-dependent oxidoreductase [Lentimicrobiaceae bacterium]